MRSIIHILILIVAFANISLAQHKAFTFDEAQKAGKSYAHLDSLYKSAVHSDTLLAVFKTGPEQLALTNAYKKLIQDLGNHLTKNNFPWEQPTRCFNRIYLSADGKIDYFLFHFLPGNEKPLSDARQTQFKQLVNEFAKEYQFGVTARERFAQCSPVVYGRK